ncbi:hypothetical protein [[Pseudomonas] boreopolis]|uniref:hypothetical protein n=1 Tax=Xanthomonas boreopolis TaxID=86183 RepID=UPI003D5C34FD
MGISPSATEVVPCARLAWREVPGTTRMARDSGVKLARAGAMRAKKARKNSD